MQQLDGDDDDLGAQFWELILDRVKYLISIGLDVPQETIDDLLLWEMELEGLLEKFEN